MNDTAFQPCACGSGLRYERCCGLDFTDAQHAGASRQMTPMLEQALRAHRHGEANEAERLCLAVLESAPGQTGALSVLYEIRQAQGRNEAAEALLRRVVALDPNNFLATNELALRLLAQGKLTEAEQHARNAIRIAPENPQAHNLMGMIMTESQRPMIGEFHYRRVLELTGTRQPIILANLAWSLKNQGRMAEARALYEESTAAAPEVKQTLLGWARLEEADRDIAAAAEKLDRIDRIWPDDPAAMTVRAVLLAREKRFEEALAMLNNAAALMPEKCLGSEETLEKGRLLDAMGRYDEAYAAFDEGKLIARKLSGNTYPEATAAAMFGKLTGFFIAGRMQSLPRAARRTDGAQPIFILGFPRSGTTLVEQTLSAHPRIAAGDELPLIEEIAGIVPRLLNSPLGYPDALAELWMGDQCAGLDILRDFYLHKVRRLGILGPRDAWFTDKMPLNETHLGLIGLIFPQAPLIHVIRHPLDVMVSAISNHFSHGLYCASTLETAARHYVRVMDLVEHTRAAMPLSYLPVRYEDMVADQERVVRLMLDFIGARFDKRCLRFHENTRYARTASYAQVTEKLYQRARNRYRNYRSHLEPVIPILQPTIERLGYKVD